MKYLNEIKDWQEMKNQIICGDCLEGMKLIPDKSIDLVLTDPPYGMDYQSSWRTATETFDKITLDQDIDWFPQLAKEIYRILKDNSHCYIFCNDYAISHFRKELENVGFTTKRTLVWVKDNHTSGDLEGDYGNKTEFILYCQKGRRELNGKRDTNVLQFSRVNNLKHPTQKPISICQYLIEKSSKKTDLICDPFMGSWTTARACKDLGRAFLGFELSEKYCQVGEERLRQEVLF
jgi:site-specific DNA-methyltransferase (adenine-specific)